MQQQGRLAEAEKLYNRILAQFPQHAPALHFLGLALHQRDQHEQANRLMRQALAIAPDNPVFLTNTIHALMGQGLTQQALPLFQTLIDLDPANAPAWHELGAALNQLGGKEDAIDCWRRALAIDPNYKPAVLALGDELREMTFRDEAATVYRQALRQAPHDTELICSLAELLIESGHADQAVTLLDNSPGSNTPDINYYRGIAQLTLGTFKESNTSFRRTIELAPDFYHAYVHLTATEKIALNDPIYEYLERVSHTEQLRSAEQQVNVEFSLGKILQDNEQYDHAFEHFTAGNRACRTIRPYSSQQQAKQAAALKTRIDADFIEKMHAFGNPSELPVFIVGMPRSGTTLTEQILARHPAVHSGGEMVLLHGILRKHLGRKYRLELANGLADMDSETFARIGTELVTGLTQIADGASRITDKMPSNFLLSGWLHALLPNARIIHCQRSPLDTCVSCYTTLFNRSHEFSNDLEDLGRYYSVYLDMMAHWRSLLPAERLFELNYEALVADPEPVVRRMLDFIGLPWDPACLTFGKTSKTVQTASVLQVRQPLYGSSVGRWRHYAAHLAPLQAALRISG